MEGSKSKADVIKTVIMKAGIPLAISVAGFIWARNIATRRKTSESFRCTDSESSNEERTSLEVRDKPGFQEEILGLGKILESLQDREWKLETLFLQYCELRDREALLLEIGKALELELGRVEALSQEVLSMEAEHRRVAGIALEYDKVLEEMQCRKSESGAMQRKVKKLSRKVREQSDFVRESNLRIEAQEKEISSNRLALESERAAVKKMEAEISDLRAVLEQLQHEKEEFWIKLSSIKESVSKVELESVSMEDFKQLLKELEQLQKEQAVEEKELIYLRWSSACLRHEMMRSHINHQGDHENHDCLKMKTDSSEWEAAKKKPGVEIMSQTKKGLLRPSRLALNTFQRVRSCCRS